MTVLEVIQRSADFLAKREVEAPRLQVELILAHVLQLPRLKLYLDFGREISASEAEVVRQLVKRRARREPLQHILGSTSFCGLEIKVTRQVLVPRPETELLAERAWNFLQSLPAPSVALDFGTGSGCVAIAIASRCPTTEVHAVDSSIEALQVATANAGSHGIQQAIQFYAGDGFEPLPPQLHFDLIVSNPPYIPTAEIETLAPEVRDHDPRAALDGGPDGLDFYRRLAREAPGRLRPGGRLMLEFGDRQEERIREFCVQHKWIVESCEPDYSGRPRILTARRP